MKIKRNIFIFLITSIILIFTIISVNNPKKISFYLLNTKNELKLGELIIISFLTGLSFTSVINISDNFINKNLNKKPEPNFSDNNELNNQNLEYFDYEDLESVSRPPERDIRDSQPTVSVNYRFVDQERESNSIKTSENTDEKDNDWINDRSEW